LGLSISAVAVAANERLLSDKQMPLPHAWKDFAHPRYRGWIVLARPQESRATQVLLGGLLSLLYPKGWDYWKQLDRNLFQYAQSAALPARLVARGETILAIDFEKRLLEQKRAGKKLRLYYPTPTFYELEGAALLKKAPHAE